MKGRVEKELALQESFSIGWERGRRSFLKVAPEQRAEAPFGD